MATSETPLAQLRHDLRTPINHILGYSELLEEDLTESGMRDLDDLKKIQAAARQLLEIIQSRLSEDLPGAAPAAPPAATAISSGPPGTTEHSTLGPVAVTGRILVVDDNADNREVLAKRLHRQGHGTAQAADGRQALAALADGAFDLVLLDVMMPVLDGYATLLEMKADTRWRHIPVIMISALDEIESIVRCIEAGAEDYLPKPFNPTLLRARIGASLEKKALRDQEQSHLRTIEQTQRRLEAELREAARYVAANLPVPMTDPFGISWVYEPSTELGGDAFGYHWIDQRYFAVYLLDVCGHGVGAGLHSIAALHVIRTGALPETDMRDPGQVLMSLNEAFQMDRNNDMYFTIWYGVYDVEARSLRYASGGHPPAILLLPEVAGEDSIVPLRSPGMLIGGMRGLDYGSKIVDVPPGSRLFVFCDGAYEILRPDGRMLTFGGDFVPFMREHGRHPDVANDVLTWIRAESDSLTLEDDYSFVAIDFPE